MLVRAAPRQAGRHSAGIIGRTVEQGLATAVVAATLAFELELKLKPKFTPRYRYHRNDHDNDSEATLGQAPAPILTNVRSSLSRLGSSLSLTHIGLAPITARPMPHPGKALVLRHTFF